jgi:hypothetical protein
MKPHTNEVCNLLKIIVDQAILLAVILNGSISERGVSLDYLARHFECQNIRLMCYDRDLEVLENRKLIKYLNKRNPIEDFCRLYLVPQPVIEALKEGKKYVPESHKNYSSEQVHQLLFHWFDRLYNDNLCVETLLENVEELLKKNRKSKMLTKIKKYELSSHDELTVLYLCNMVFNMEENEVSLHSLHVIFLIKNCINNLKINILCWKFQKMN